MAESNARTSGAAGADGVELVITREFDAPRDLVFKAWTEAERLAHWWGPKGFTWVSATLDLTPGGVFHYHMRSPGGDDMWGKFVYHEIDAPERLVFTNSFSDEAANTVRAPFNPNWPLEVMNTVTFAESGAKTLVTLRGVPYNANDAEREAFGNFHASMRAGFGGSMDQLDAYLRTV